MRALDGNMQEDREKEGNTTLNQPERSAPSFDDIICEDGLLHKLVSKLPLDEAVRTSVLSKRWKYIWTFVPNLYVSVPDYGTLLMRCQDDDERNALIKEKTDKAVEGMDVLLNKHCGYGVETFKVDIPFYEKHADSLDRWVAFAVAANTKELVIKFQTLDCRPPYGDEIYYFPFRLLFQQNQQSSLEHLYFESCSMFVPSGVGSLSVLHTLELHLVHTGDEDFENLVSACSVMERLIVQGCAGLVDMRIRQQSGRLKYLTVEDCTSLMSIDVRGAHLITLSEGEEKIEILFDDSSRVKEMFIYFSCFADYLDYIVLTLPNAVPHCQKLSLRFDHGTSNYKLIGDPEMVYPRFEHLKHLEVTVGDLMGDDILLWLVPLLEAAPFLVKFILRVDEEESCMAEEEEVEAIKNLTLAHLEEVEIDGFTGSKGQLSFLWYLVHNASSLRSMKIIGSSSRYTKEGCEGTLPSELEKICEYFISRE